MRRFEEQVRNTLHKDMEIPKVVREHADSAFSQIQRQKVNRRKIPGRINYSIQAAAIVAAVVLATGTTAFAAAKHFGILDYFTGQKVELTKNATEMIVTQVEQQEKTETLADFKIREYLCDSNQMYVVIEARPLDSQKYLIIPEDIIGEDSVEVLNLPGVTEGTVAEYAKSQGKELLYAGVHVNTGAGSYTEEFRMEQDGTALFIQSSPNEIDEKVSELICDTCIYPIGIQNDDEIIRDSFTFTVADTSKEKALPYTITNTEGADAVGIVMDDISITETELGIHVEFLYHYADNLSQEQRTENEDIGFQILDKDGVELKTNPDVAGWGVKLEDGSYKEIRNYQKTQLPNELTILVKNFFTKEEIGTMKLTKE